MLGDESLPVVYNGIELEGIPFNDQPEDFFIAVGRMTPGKGIAEAIRIAKRASARLLIVGQITSHLPWSEKYFLKEIQPHIDGNRVRHIERLPHEQLMQTVGRAKGFLFPPRWEDPFGLAVAARRLSSMSAAGLEPLLLLAVADSITFARPSWNIPGWFLFSAARSITHVWQTGCRLSRSIL